MFKKILFRTLYIVAFLVIIANTAISAAKSLNPDINDLPKGELSVSYPSPDGNSRIDIYIVQSNFGSAVRGDYVRGNEHKNIYWQTGADSATVRCLTDDTVTIDDVHLFINTEVYDSRLSYAIFSGGIIRENIEK